MECQTFATEKNFGSQNFCFSWKENLKKCTDFEEVQGIFRETFILALSPSSVFCLQNYVPDFF